MGPLGGVKAFDLLRAHHCHDAREIVDAVQLEVVGCEVVRVPLTKLLLQGLELAFHDLRNLEVHRCQDVGAVT